MFSWIPTLNNYLGWDLWWQFQRNYATIGWEHKLIMGPAILGNKPYLTIKNITNSLYVEWLTSQTLLLFGSQIEWQSLVRWFPVWSLNFLGNTFTLWADLRMGHGNSPPFSVKFCQYSILSKITISIYIAGKCPGVPPNPLSLSEFSWSSPAHNAICFSAFYKITVKCRILLNFYFGHTLGARGFFFQIVSTAYFILRISRVGLWSQGTLAKFGREKVKP